MSFAAALAEMHAACDGVFGLAASFKPAAGGAHACRVEKHAPTPVLGFGEAQAAAPACVLRVLKSALPAKPRAGDAFEIFADDGVTVAETWRVLTPPTIEDDDGLRYTIDVEPA